MCNVPNRDVRTARYACGMTTDLEPIRNIAAHWECETCGWVGIVNLDERSSGLAVHQRTREHHSELSPDCPTPKLFDPRR